MGREIRRVKPDWVHPIGIRGYIPLQEGFNEALMQWLEQEILWNKGEHEYCGKYISYIDYAGEKPNPEEYMPDWTEDEKTAYQIYETVSEGTPVSPVCKTREELIDWLVNNGHGMGIGGTRFRMTPEEADLWIDECGWAPTMMISNGVICGGVEYMVKNPIGEKNEH